MSHISTAELTIQAARELTFALCNTASAAPFAHIGHNQHDALEKLANIFEEIAYFKGSAPYIEQVPVPAPSVMTPPVPSAAPSVKPYLAPPPRVTPPVPKTVALIPRVHITSTTPHSHRRLNPTIRTLVPPPTFDL
jgi:hypothetical protein